MTKIVTRRENGTQSILVTILRLPSEPRVTLHLSTLKTKIVEKMGMRAKLISFSDNPETVLKRRVFFSCDTELENMCIAIKCYLLENVIFIFFFYFFLFQLLSPFSLTLSFFLSLVSPYSPPSFPSYRPLSFSFIFDVYHDLYFKNIITFKWKLVSHKTSKQKSENNIHTKKEPH